MPGSRVFILSLLVVAFLTATTMPTVSHAAYLELSATAFKALNKTIGAAPAADGTRIRNLYGDLLSSQKEDRQLDETIKASRARNAEAESALRKSIREVDRALIERLETASKQKKEKYKPLFDSYTLLNQQISTARALGNKDLNAALRLQANVLKLSVEAARADIRMQDQKLKQARAAAANKIKELRTMLDGLAPHKAAITALKQTASQANKRKSEEWSVLNERVRRGDASGTAASLATLLSVSRSMVDSKKSIQSRETAIADLLRKTTARLNSLKAV